VEHTDTNTTGNSEVVASATSPGDLRAHAGDLAGASTSSTASIRRSGSDGPSCGAWTPGWRAVRTFAPAPCCSTSRATTADITSIISTPELSAAGVPSRAPRISATKQPGRAWGTTRARTLLPRASERNDAHARLLSKRVADMGTLVGIRVLDHQTESYRRHDHIVFVGDDAASDWTRRCRRQADEILLVGGAGNSPKSSPPDERSTHPTTYFDDLWIDFLCTTTDLTSAAQRIHTRGRLRQFVHRSCSLPMVMAPVSLDGHLLVDGGIMNNVPVDPLPEVSNEGTLIVADVADCFYTADEAYDDDDDSIAFRRVPSSRLNQFGEKLVASAFSTSSCDRSRSGARSSSCRRSQRTASVCAPR